MVAESAASRSDWSRINVSGNARAHLGHSYVTNNITVTASLAHDVYRACVVSASSFQPLAKEVASFKALLEITKETITLAEPERYLTERITTILSTCSECLKAVQVSVAMYNDLPTSSQRTWERMEWGSKQLSDLQLQLGRNIGVLTALNSNLASSSQVAVQHMLQKFMDEVRTGKREGSVVSTHSVDSLLYEERLAWRILRKELEDVGITPEVFEKHKELISKTLRDAIESDTLQELPDEESDTESSPQTRPASDTNLAAISNNFAVTRKPLATLDSELTAKQLSTKEEATPPKLKFDILANPSSTKESPAMLQLVPNSISSSLDGKTVALSPDSKVLASAPRDKAARTISESILQIFKARRTGAALQTLKGHTGWVNPVAFSPDGKVVASASYDKTIRLWDTATGAALQKLKGHTDSISSVAFSPDGKVVASGSYDKTVRLWDAATGAALQTLKGHTGSVNSVAFSPDGKVVASGSYDKTVRLWDAATGAALQTLKGHTGSVNLVAFSPDSKVVASGSGDKTVQLRDAATGAALQTLKGHTESVSPVAFSPDGKVVASASYDKTIRLWDTATGAALQTLKGHTESVSPVAFSPDGKVVASGSYDKTVRLWDAATGAALQTLKGHTDSVSSVAFSPDGKVVASGSGDKTVQLWDAATGAALQTLKGHTGWVLSVAFSPDGRMVASASFDKTVRLWDAASGRFPHN